MSESGFPKHIDVIDSHTAGEPTRCVFTGIPPLGAGSMAERLEILRSQYDDYRRAILCEPRGSEVLVGALVLEPLSPEAAAGVIFFNNSGYLGMCGHGTIGVTATLAWMGKIAPGSHTIETPVGTVSVTLAEDGQITISNVESYCFREGVIVDVPGHGLVRGDVAWGGNWFFLTQDHPFRLTLDKADELTEFTWRVRQALAAQGITGENGADIDHIELFTAPHNPSNHSRNFVLCPGKEYDRSPCGTGTSAKMACLAAEGKLVPGQLWRQEGILDTAFTGSITLTENGVLPQITGSAFVTAQSTLIFDANDPFARGIQPLDLQSSDFQSLELQPSDLQSSDLQTPELESSGLAGQ
jgi:4-hydroxyproline epimerase